MVRQEAGMQTETNEIGYVAAFPIAEVNRGINAFTLGVRSVNPDATVYVKWSNSWTGEEENAETARELIRDHAIDVLAMHTNALSPLEIADENDIWTIGYNIDNKNPSPLTYPFIYHRILHLLHTSQNVPTTVHR